MISNFCWEGPAWGGAFLNICFSRRAWFLHTGWLDHYIRLIRYCSIFIFCWKWLPLQKHTYGTHEVSKRTYSEEWHWLRAFSCWNFRSIDSHRGHAAARKWGNMVGVLELCHFCRGSPNGQPLLRDSPWLWPSQSCTAARGSFYPIPLSTPFFLSQDSALCLL